MLRTGAELSECERYRYVLWRQWHWDELGQHCMFIGLNPSTADALKDDPTLRRCIRFARAWGCAGLYMLNLYAFRATNPADMVSAADPRGSCNLRTFEHYRNRCGLIVAAWGSLAVRYRPRVRWASTITAVQAVLDKPMHCLGCTADGSPRHPLYVRGDTPLQVYWSPTVTDQAAKAAEMGEG